MQKVIGVLFTVLLILTLATGARAEDMTEETVIENGSLVVKKVQVVRTELERYPMPKFEFLAQDISKIRDIMRTGQGEYVLEKKAERTWQWGFPMRSKIREIKTSSVFQNGTWSEPKSVVGPEAPGEGWPLTILLVIIAISVLVMSVAHQKSGKSEWWLAVFYGALIAMMGSFYMSATIALTIAIIITITFIITITAAIAAIAFITITFTITIAFATNQQVEYAIFMACVIVGSYLLAKLAKRLGWIKVVEKPAESTT